MESTPREIQILAENQSSVSNGNKEEQEGICLSTALPASLRKLHRVILKPLGNTSTLLCYKSLKSLCFGGGKQLAQAWSACSPPWIKLQPYVSCQGSFTLAGAPQGSVLSSPLRSPFVLIFLSSHIQGMQLQQPEHLWTPGFAVELQVSPTWSSQPPLACAWTSLSHPARNFYFATSWASRPAKGL